MTSRRVRSGRAIAGHRDYPNAALMQSSSARYLLHDILVSVMSLVSMAAELIWRSERHQLINRHWYHGGTRVDLTIIYGEVDEPNSTSVGEESQM